MRLVRLGQQPSRVAEDVRAALASLGRGSTVIGGVALVGARPTGDRPVEAVVVLPTGVLVVIGVDLPDPALRLEAPLSGPWKADGWPLVHGDDVNPATEALDLSQECERRIAELGGGPVGTIVAVGPYVETVDQPPGDLAGPVRVLHPTPTTMLAATVSLATARHPRSVDQARALIAALAPDAPELSDEVLRGEGFVRFADDVPVPPGPRSPVTASAGAGVGVAGIATTAGAAATPASNGVAAPKSVSSPRPAVAAPATSAPAAAAPGAVAEGAAGSGSATPDSARVGNGQPTNSSSAPAATNQPTSTGSTPAAAGQPTSSSSAPTTSQPASSSSGPALASQPANSGPVPAATGQPANSSSAAAGSGPSGAGAAVATPAGPSAVPGGTTATPKPQAPAGLPVFPGGSNASIAAGSAVASPSTPSVPPEPAVPPAPRPKIIAVRPPRPEIPSIEPDSLAEAPTESTDPPEAPTEKMPSPAKPQSTERPRGAVPPVAPVHVPGPSSAPQPARPAPVAAAGATSAGAEPGKPASRTVKWVPIAAIVLLVVLVVSAIVVATSGGDETTAAPPASSAPPSSVPSPAPSSVTSSAPPAPTLTFEPRASSADQKCASHAFGDVQASLQQTSCSAVRRASYTALVDGRPAAVTVAVVEFPDAGQANRLKQIADNPGGGGILDVATETGKWPSGPPQFDGAAYASKIDGNGVRLVQAVWQPGPSTADDPGLARAAKGALDLHLPS
ncbi:hypothetical protein F9C11_38895 [Amycolatopsis sp. VS8301801F10]|uniref:hypothetical protein n=1 Tax=Amycolatopsis sp. VS8301801F10 TaxID=2652442 RepID=UPI0038FC169C